MQERSLVLLFGTRDSLVSEDSKKLLSDDATVPTMIVIHNDDFSKLTVYDRVTPTGEKIDVGRDQM
jgi:hypothetical protein